MTTRWWSILQMLISIVKNKDTTTLTLRDAKKIQLILTCEEMKRIEEIIALLKCFKAKTDKLGAQDDITITLILPTFKGAEGSKRFILAKNFFSNFHIFV